MIERWREAYEAAPEIFDAFRRAEVPAGRIVAAFREHARPAGRDVLEVGSGSGRLARALADDARRYVAVEPAAPMLRMALRSAPASAHFVRARGEALPVRRAVVDLVVSGWVFAFLPGSIRSRALDEAVRVVRPGQDGGIWLIENHWKSEFQELRGRAGDAASSEIQPLLGAGFRIVTTVETEVRFATADACERTLGYLCGDAAAARLRERPRSRLEHRVVLLHHAT